MTNAFWSAIDAQLTELTHAKTADDVLKILSHERNPYNTPETTEVVSTSDGFFAGSGGDATVKEALTEAGWRTVWAQAAYYYVMAAPNGDQITYVEGDIYRGDQRPAFDR